MGRQRNLSVITVRTTQLLSSRGLLSQRRQCTSLQRSFNIEFVVSLFVIDISIVNMIMTENAPERLTLHYWSETLFTDTIAKTKSKQLVPLKAHRYISSKELIFSSTTCCTASSMGMSPPITSNTRPTVA